MKFYKYFSGLLIKRTTCLYSTRDRLKIVNEYLTKVLTKKIRIIPYCDFKSFMLFITTLYVYIEMNRFSANSLEGS